MTQEAGNGVFLQRNGVRLQANGRKRYTSGWKLKLNGRKPIVNGRKPTSNGRKPTSNGRKPFSKFKGVAQINKYNNNKKQAEKYLSACFLFSIKVRQLLLLVSHTSAFLQFDHKYTSPLLTHLLGTCRRTF